jgi:hypothetical protein
MPTHSANLIILLHYMPQDSERKNKTASPSPCFARPSKRLQDNQTLYFPDL